MKNLSLLFFVILSIVCVTCGHDMLSPGGVCDKKYALCTSAPCIPDPENPNKAICFCEVYTGKSFGQIACDRRMNFVDEKGIEHLTSTYSFAQYDSKKTLTCPDGSPWTFCLDKPCTVDPADPKKAICQCEVKHSGEFVTLGGNCDKSTCKTSYWSAASPQDTQGAMAILVKSLGLTQAPSNYCPE